MKCNVFVLVVGKQYFDSKKFSLVLEVHVVLRCDLRAATATAAAAE